MGEQAEARAGERCARIEELLGEIQQGADAAKEELFTLCYDELRRVAARLLVNERTSHTLQPTALVHQAYFKLFVGRPLRAWDRCYFFAAQARAMRQVLVDHARKRNAEKRPDHRRRVPLDDLLRAFEATQKVAFLDLDAALEELNQLSPRQHDVVALRFFGGLRWSEIASHLGTSVSTVEKDWQLARAFLYRRLCGVTQ